MRVQLRPNASKMNACLSACLTTNKNNSDMISSSTAVVYNPGTQLYGRKGATLFTHLTLEVHHLLARKGKKMNRRWYGDLKNLTNVSLLHPINSVYFSL